MHNSGVSIKRLCQSASAPMEAGYGCPGSWDGGKCSLPSFFYGQKEVPDSVHDDSLSSFLFFLEIEVNFI